MLYLFNYILKNHERLPQIFHEKKFKKNVSFNVCIFKVLQRIKKKITQKNIKIF